MAILFLLSEDDHQEHGYAWTKDRIKAELEREGLGEDFFDDGEDFPIVDTSPTYTKVSKK